MTAATSSDEVQPVPQAKPRLQFRIRDLLLLTLWASLLLAGIVQESAILIVLWGCWSAVWVVRDAITRRRFTLIELLILVAIAGIIVSAVEPTIHFHPRR